MLRAKKVASITDGATKKRSKDLLHIHWTFSESQSFLLAGLIQTQILKIIIDVLELLSSGFLPGTNLILETPPGDIIPINTATIMRWWFLEESTYRYSQTLLCLTAWLSASLYLSVSQVVPVYSSPTALCKTEAVSVYLDSVWRL